MSTRDWRNLSLADGGRSLIEASAGTGKTWTIAALYLRLLIERALTPRQIAVATFNNAAADELRQRIRDRVQRAALQAQQPGSAIEQPDDVDRWLSEHLADDARARHIALHLRLALAELDIAPIGTLHALCQRILREQPFHTGSGFGAVTLVDGKRLQAELVDDLWRQWTQADAAPGAPAQVWVEAGREPLANALSLAMRPGVRLPVAEDDGVARLLAEGDAAALRALADDASWFARKNAVWREAFRCLADWIASGNSTALPHIDVIKKLQEPIEKQIHKTRLEEAAAVAGFAYAQRAAEVLAHAATRRKLAGLMAAAPMLQAAAHTRMQARHQRSFDSLIVEVHAALQRSRAVADALFAQWPVALVDEFQDTDSLQYGVLDAIYRDAAGAVRGQLAMIGDPKQAIYAFRGGDVHTYLRAAASIGDDERLPLAVNQRSTGAYVQACNELFAQVDRRLSTAPQEADEIRYVDVQASGRQDARGLTIDGVAVQRPLVFHHRPDPVEAPTPRVDERRRDALQACTHLIVQWLDGRHAIGGKPVQPGDIAVLLPKNGDVLALRQRLIAEGVPCVGAGRSSVFHSRWADALRLQLQCAADPRNMAALRAALATPLGGETFATLRGWRDADADSDPRWQAALRQAETWHTTWQRRGVLAAVQTMIDAASARLAGLPAAERERALTDLRHLGELLQAREAQVPGQRELLAWLQGQCEAKGAEDEDAAEEQSLRLESDARRVQLMTLHAAKGLEFPIVLLPLLWDQTGRRESVVAVTDAEPGRVLRMDAQAIARHAQEAQDERMRLLYVALTRASHACHVFTLDPYRHKQPGSLQMWEDPQRAALDALLARAGGVVRGDHIDWRTGWPQGSATMPASTAADRQPAQVRTAPAPPERLPRRHSFSTLVHHGTSGVLEESAASDEAVALVPAEMAASIPTPHADLLALQAWRGPELGNALHDMLEQRAIGTDLVEQGELIARLLRRRGVAMPPAAMQTLAQRLDAVLAYPLLPGLCLRELPALALRAEMSFDYVLDAVAVAQLQGVLREHGWQVPQLPEVTLHGAMTGKIDLVFEHAGCFHVLDWKGNWLGDAVDHYRGQALQAAMAAHDYRLQALLYTVAVDRHLRSRLGPAYTRARLGETVYLFVRAVGLQGDAGVWRERFDDALLDAVDAVLGAPRGAA